MTGGTEVLIFAPEFANLLAKTTGGFDHLHLNIVDARLHTTPAGYALFDVEDRVTEADVILIPVLPSIIDIHSTADFIRDLLLVGKARTHNTRLAIVTNRTRIRTRAVDKLERFLDNLDIPVIARIRDTQHYVAAAEQGVGIHELGERDAAKDADCWASLLDWLDETWPEADAEPQALRHYSG